MIYQVRKTSAGREYWDTKKKVVLFVPHGLEPKFEVEEEPDSFITPEEETVEKVNPFLAMTLKEMKSYAEEHEIDIPENIKKHDDVAKYLDSNG